MLLHTPLIPGTLLKRYKRFLCDVQLTSGEVVTAHCANTGSMLGVALPGAEVWLSHATNPSSKLRYKLELVGLPTSLVGVNTHNANKIVQRALEAKLIGELASYQNFKPEATFTPGCRFDFLLTGDINHSPNCYLEVKSITLSRKAGVAEFPDTITQRGVKHLTMLIEAKKQGYRTALLYLIQREDCTAFQVAHDIDPKYQATLAKAKALGVEVLCYRCCVSTQKITLQKPVATSF